MSSDDKTRVENPTLQAGGWASMGRRIMGLAALLIVAILVVVVVLSWRRIGGPTMSVPEMLPRNCALMVETRELGALFKLAVNMPIWNTQAREEAANSWSQLHNTLSSWMTARMMGDGIRLSNNWLATAKQAGFALGPNGEWILFLELPDPKFSLLEMDRDPNLNFSSPDRKPVTAKLHSAKPNFYARTLGYWLVLSSSEQLIDFAAKDGEKDSIGASGVLPPWRRQTAFRGVIDPRAKFFIPTDEKWEKLASIMQTDARLTFAGRSESPGAIEWRIEGGMAKYPEASGFFWMVGKWVLAALLFACIALVVLMLAVLSGLTSMHKIMSWWKGVKPAPAPKPVTMSDSMKEDLETGHAALRAERSGEPGATPRQDDSADKSENAVVETAETGAADQPAKPARKRPTAKAKKVDAENGDAPAKPARPRRSRKAEPKADDSAQPSEDVEDSEEET